MAFDKRTDPGSRDGSASQSGLFGRNRGKKPVAVPSGRADRITTIGPAPLPPAVPGPLGYSFRNIPNFGDNQDRIQVIQQHKVIRTDGYFAHGGNGSILPGSSAVAWLQANFLANLYPFLHEKAQRRDGYRSTDTPPLTTPTLPYGIVGHTISLKVNIRVLSTLYGSIFANEGTRSMLTAFTGLEDRIRTDLEASNRLMYPKGYDAIIDYWSKVVTPYLGGPVIYALFDLQDWNYTGIWAPASGSFTAWAGNNRPDLTLAADVDALLDDIELALSMQLNRNLSDAGGGLTDFKKWDSLLSMTGMEMPQTGRSDITIDPIMWNERLLGGAFHYLDSKGAGADTFVGWPDMRGDPQTLININAINNSFPGADDTLYWIGAKGTYAYEFDDDDTPGYTAEANDITALGLVHDTGFGSQFSGGNLHAERLYTLEDGWYEPVDRLDYTAASGLQAHLWSIPQVTIHPESWRVIMSEETEETYMSNFKTPGFQVPVDVFGQTFRKWMFDIWGLPYIT